MAGMRVRVLAMRTRAHGERSRQPLWGRMLLHEMTAPHARTCLREHGSERQRCKVTPISSSCICPLLLQPNTLPQPTHAHTT